MGVSYLQFPFHPILLIIKNLQGYLKNSRPGKESWRKARVINLFLDACLYGNSFSKTDHQNGLGNNRKLKTFLLI